MESIRHSDCIIILLLASHRVSILIPDDIKHALQSGYGRESLRQLGLSANEARFWRTLWLKDPSLSSLKSDPTDGSALAPVENPQGMCMTKTTVQYNSAGQVVGEWRRLSPVQRALSLLTEKLCRDIDVFFEAPKTLKPAVPNQNLMLEAVISDAHLAMLSWKEETGQNYDIKIGTQAVLSAMDHLTDGRSAGLGVLVFNGDSMHTDNRSGVTEHSGNVLDTDSRYHYMVEHTEEVIKQSVLRMLRCCDRVMLIVTPGNHDWHTSVCMSRILNAYFSREPRVIERTEAYPRRCTVFGNVMLTHAHGDKIKPKDWQGVISTDFAEEWGRTKHRYLHLGHIHHGRAMQPFVADEQRGLHVEYLESLCPIDAWHADNGFTGTASGAQGFLYHCEHGLQERYYWNLSQLENYGLSSVQENDRGQPHGYGQESIKDWRECH